MLKRGISNLIRSFLGYNTWEDYKKWYTKVHSRARYKSGFTDKLKKEIKELYNYECGECGLTENLEVHHIDGDFTNNEKSNLKYLCKKCHIEYERLQRGSYSS